MVGRGRIPDPLRAKLADPPREPARRIKEHGERGGYRIGVAAAQEQNETLGGSEVSVSGRSCERSALLIAHERSAAISA